jgi:hypothetical protein
MEIDRVKMKALTKENYKFFDLNRDAIVAGHIGEYVLIRDCAVIGYFTERMSAYVPLAHTHAEPGSYLIQQCLAEEEEIDIGCHIPIPAFEVDWR